MSSSPSSSRVPSLFTSHPSVAFSNLQEDKLEQVLDDLDRNSRMEPITCLKQVTFNADGSIGQPAGRLTRWAFFQLCNHVCSGLYELGLDLSGWQRKLEEERDACSLEVTIDILNLVIRQRFDSKLCGRLLLLNESAGTVDGLLTPAYRWLSNLELLQRARAMAVDAPEDGRPMRFLEAVLHGRWLLLRYIRPKTVAVLSSPSGLDDSFHLGYHLSNNEVGQASVRGAAFICRRQERTAALLPFASDTQTRHAGGMFAERLDTLMQRLPGQIRGVTTQVLRMLKRSVESQLPLGNKDAELEKQQVGVITAALVKYGLTKTLARRAVAGVVYRGSYDERSEDPVLFQHTGRSVFDLYNALGRLAINLPISARERVERAAYALLSGKISIASPK